MTTSFDSLSENPKDISWSEFLLVAAATICAAYIFDELFRPIRDVENIEKLLWYVGYGASYLLLPGLVVLLTHLIAKHESIGSDSIDP